MKLFLILTRSELMIWVEKRFFYHFGFHLVGAREGTNNAIHKPAICVSLLLSSLGWMIGWFLVLPIWSYVQAALTGQSASHYVESFHPSLFPLWRNSLQNTPLQPYLHLSTLQRHRRLHSRSCSYLSVLQRHGSSRILHTDFSRNWIFLLHGMLGLWRKWPFTGQRIFVFALQRQRRKKQKEINIRCRLK